jgi:acyl-[acyl-carrier-protein]-phospholipid O-acyltransferase/long-chain-fatty-acid--[acyl-carrier-protein] ligase
MWVIGIVIVILAVIGSVTSFGIPSVAAVLPWTPFRLNPWAGIGEGMQTLRRNPTLGLAVVGISYFWFLGALLQLVVVLFGAQVLQLDDRWVGVLTACSAVGIGAEPDRRPVGRARTDVSSSPSPERARPAVDRSAGCTGAVRQ